MYHILDNPLALSCREFLNPKLIKKAEDVDEVQECVVGKAMLDVVDLHFGFVAARL